MPDYLRAAQIHVLYSHPQLLNATVKPNELTSQAEVLDWVGKQKEVFGETLPLTPMSEQLVDAVINPIGKESSKGYK